MSVKSAYNRCCCLRAFVYRLYVIFLFRHTPTGIHGYPNHGKQLPDFTVHVHMYYFIIRLVKQSNVIVVYCTEIETNHGIVQCTHYLVGHILQLGIIFVRMRKTIIIDMKSNFSMFIF